MAPKGGSINKQAALARARERRRKLDRDRDAQDHRIEEATARALVAIDARAEAQAAVTRATADLGVVVRTLLEEDLTVERAASLLEIDVTEVRRLSKAPTPEVQTKPTAAEKAAPVISSVTAVPAHAGQGDDAARRAG
jgi:hypothetical protein